MKKLLFATATTLLCATAFFAGRRSTQTTTYAKHGVVTELDRANDTVTFTDCNGFNWCFYGVEDWMIGDGVSAVMNDNGTDSIFDDEVVNVRYERD
jgi:hypothetical protein